MRIAFIVHDYHRRGGHSRYVYELATRFAREHEVHVFSTVVEGDRDPKITFHYVPSLRLTTLTSILSFILPATLRFLGQFDIVHAQGLCGLRQNVATMHMCQAAWYKGLKGAMGELTFKQRLSQILVQPLEKYVFQEKRTKHVIAVSRLGRRELERQYGRKRDVTVIYHGVDLATFHPANRLRWRAEVRSEWNIGYDKLVALYVGDLQKGALPAIEAVSRVEGTRLVLVSGSDPEPYKRFAATLDAAARVHFMPSTTAIERQYAASDVFLFPTLFDLFGMVITEAMASGLPVITSSAAGAAELIDPGVSGFVVDPAWNVSGFTECLLRLRDNTSLRESMAAEARKKVEHFTWNDTAIETMRVYRQVQSDTEFPPQDAP